jgi:hypothetical protein
MLNNASREAREPLSMPGKADKAQEAPASAPSAPAAPAPFNHVRHLREFQLPDDRPVCIHRHAVLFATPLKDDPSQTLVAVKGGKSPMPLKINYVTFLGWWAKN